MKRLLTFFTFFIFLTSVSQNLIDKNFAEVDSLYREDQFYVGLGIDILVNKPKDMSQSGFSGGLHFGYIRDMPLNQERNIAIGIGLGFSFDTYSHNLFIGETDTDQSIFDVIDSGVEFNTNRFSTQVIEMPIHFRWRTSAIGDDSAFWRIYTGFNIGYMYHFKSTFEQPNNTVNQTDLDELNRARFDYYFSFGKSKINFFFRYNLNSIFDAKLSDTQEDLKLNVIKTGVVFYIL
ncbi:porin family protein [Psychroflexus sp. MBR-150]|jgi:hypothetical protein